MKMKDFEIQMLCKVDPVEFYEEDYQYDEEQEEQDIFKGDDLPY